MIPFWEYWYPVVERSSSERRILEEALKVLQEYDWEPEFYDKEEPWVEFIRSTLPRLIADDEMECVGWIIELVESSPPDEVTAAAVTVGTLGLKMNEGWERNF